MAWTSLYGSFLIPRDQFPNDSEYVSSFLGFLFYGTGAVWYTALQPIMFIWLLILHVYKAYMDLATIHVIHSGIILQIIWVITIFLLLRVFILLAIIYKKYSELTTHLHAANKFVGYIGIWICVPNN